YVPLRNTVFLTLGAALIESRVLSLIEGGRTDPKEISVAIFIAANAVDYSGYPDCRPESIGIETPVLHMTKAQIVKLGVELGAPLEDTWSCYEGGDVPCGACDSCLLRAKGFAGAGIRDPLLERLRREGKIA
ncbi:MAG: 7-cyano-7-deazaguanine synthase, partial [Methanomicrobiales archaeon]|nr:7-cyano-7-deazaguanine synthase [Methanomicrobiales archaeon]